jgi:mRNA-degrading endonuclease YafQ of YafQ-DinJ toxin-antitoxin module
VSLKEVKKELQTAAKGKNEIHEVVNILEHTRPVTAAVQDHVSQNRGT